MHSEQSATVAVPHVHMLMGLVPVSTPASDASDGVPVSSGPVSICCITSLPASLPLMGASLPTLTSVDASTPVPTVPPHAWTTPYEMQGTTKKANRARM